MEDLHTELPESREQAVRENLRVQKTAYIQQQLARQREDEDRRMAQLQQEQTVINELRGAIDASLWETQELRQYNREFQENVNAQVYEAHGISADKLTGMRMYRSALYRGVALVSLLLSVALTVFAGVIHGFSSQICLLLAAYTAAQGALLAQENQRGKVLRWVCRVLYLLTLPMMAAAFVGYELHFALFDLVFPYAAIPALAFTVLGVLMYFLYDPYAQDRKFLRQASRELRKIERQAKSQVNTAAKARKKEEKAAEKAAAPVTPVQSAETTEPPAAPAADTSAAADTPEFPPEAEPLAAAPAESAPAPLPEPIVLTVSAPELPEEPEPAPAAE